MQASASVAARHRRKYERGAGGQGEAWGSERGWNKLGRQGASPAQQAIG